MLKPAGSVARYPARVLFAGYLGAILLGGVLLTLPAARAAEAAPIRLLDGLFTAASAVCVTGLTVRSTGGDFSWLGQAVILVLFQFGGIGIMTMTTFAALALRGHESFRQKMVLSETLGARPSEKLLGVLGRVVGTTLVIEGIGAVLLLPRFLWDGRGWEAFWWSLFYAVSAFCNAGFALADDSLVAYQGDLWINGVIMALAVAGGLGFPVLADLARTPPWRQGAETRPQALGRAWNAWGLTTRLVLIVSGLFLVFGTVLFLLLEGNRALAGLPWYEKVLVGMFQSVTARTAGFSTVDFNQLASSTLFVMMLLMFVGGGPCSTAGGAKVSTFAVLLLLAWNRLTGKQQVVVFHRAIGRETIDRAVTTVMLLLLFSTLGLAGILVGGETRTVQHQEHDFFLKTSFEVISAMGTVGLSTGITPVLSDWSKVCLMALMFAGRLGPLSVVLALSRTGRQVRMKHAEQEILVG